MKLSFMAFSNPGDLERERIVLKAVSDIDVGGYAVFRTGLANSGEATAGRKAAYWFPDADVKAGDLVVLYTKQGTRSSKPWKDGTAYFFYWGKDEVLWSDPNFGAVFLEIAEWNLNKVQTEPKASS